MLSLSVPRQLLSLKTTFNICNSDKVARRPWAPRFVLEFAIKTRYVLDSWKTCCCPWIFSGVLENSWIVFKLFIFEILITLNIQESIINIVNAGPSPGFRNRGPKTRRGATFLNTILDVCSNRRAKHKMGGTDFKRGAGHHWPLS